MESSAEKVKGMLKSSIKFIPTQPDKERMADLLFRKQQNIGMENFWQNGNFLYG